MRAPGTKRKVLFSDNYICAWELQVCFQIFYRKEGEGIGKRKTRKGGDVWEKGRWKKENRKLHEGNEENEPMNKKRGQVIQICEGNGRGKAFMINGKWNQAPDRLRTEDFVVDRLQEPAPVPHSTLFPVLCSVILQCPPTPIYFDLLEPIGY